MPSTIPGQGLSKAGRKGEQLTDILWKSAFELREMLRNKVVSPGEVLDATFKRLEEVEPKLGAFLEVTEKQARDGAKKAEKALLSGDGIGELCGVPLSVKDLIAVKDARLTFGSRAYRDNISTVDAPSVERARAAGAVIIGKTTTSEFGCKGVGDSPLTGVTSNPWNLKRTPGGSSCGAAASIAAGVTAFGFGTDGGGSVRIPASFTGLFGFKGHFGRIPVFPASATPTLAHVGPLARTVRDAALLLKVASGYDARDPGSVSEAVPDFVGACDSPAKGLKIAWSSTLGYATPAPEVLKITEQAAKVFDEIGCSVTTVDKVFDADPWPLLMAEFYLGVGTKLRPVLEESPELLDPSVALVLEKALGQDLSAYYKTVSQRYELRTKIEEFFADYDLLLTPTLPVPAFEVGHDAPRGYRDDNGFSWVSYTYPFNLTGLPAASIPAGFTEDGLPVGLQIIGRHLMETDILSAAAAFEDARPWADKKPPLN